MTTSWKLLIVGDTSSRPRITQVLSHVANRYELMEVVTGKEGLDMLNGPFQGSINCVILTAVLPDMTALDFLTAIRSHDRVTRAVIAVTPNKMINDSKALLNAGAQDVIDETRLTPEVLAHTIESAIIRHGLVTTSHERVVLQRENEQRLTFAMAASGGGAWEWDFLNDVAWWSDEMYPLYGVAPGTVMRLENSLAITHKDDVERQSKAVEKAIYEHTDYDCEYRILHSTLGERWMHARGRVVFDPSGAPIRLQGVTLDITEQKSAQERLRLNEERLRLATDFAEVGFWDVDLVNDTLIWPPIVKAMFGISAQVPVSMADFYNGLHPDDLDATTTAFAGALDPLRRAVYDVEYRTIGKEDGVARWVAAKGKGIFDETGRCVRVIGTAIDISRRKQAEQALRDSEARLRVLTDNAKVGLVVNGPDHRYRFVNQAYADILGLPSADLGGKHVSEVLPTVYESQIRPRLDRAFSGETVTYELVIPARGGTDERRYAVTYQPAHEAEGLPVVIVVIYDVTDLKQAEAALRESEATLRVFANTTPTLSWMSNADGGVYWYNQRWYDYTGTTFDQMKGMGWESVHDPAVLPEVKKRIQECAANCTEFEMTFPLKGADGIFRPFLTRAVPITDEEGKVTRWIGSNTDVSPERAIQAELESSQKKLRDADQRKDTFLATLAHELRNPLAPIRSAAAILALSPLTSEQLASAQQVIQRQVKHMALLLDDLLDIARITQNKLELRKEPVLLSSIIDSAVEAVRPLLDRKMHHFQISVNTDQPVVLDGDALRLSQVLSNLLTNAAKYTDPAGNITLSAYVENGFLKLTVKDNGVGIATESLDSIFTMFAQIDRNKGRSDGGLGIGLALAKGLMEMHDGTLTAHSDGPGCGSTFTCCLPILQTGPLEEPSLKNVSKTTNTRRVLIADDNEDAANTLAMLVELAGHTVRVVYGGQAALTAAQTFAPDVVFLDIGMPDINGCDVAKRIRQETWGREIYLVALTGWGQEQDRQRTSSAGFNRHLTKPIDTTAIVELLTT